MLSKLRAALNPLWFVKRLNLKVYNRDPLCSCPVTMGNLFSAAFSISFGSIFSSSPTASLMPISGRDLQAIIIIAKIERRPSAQPFNFVFGDHSQSRPCTIPRKKLGHFLSETRCCICSIGSFLSRSCHTTPFQWHFAGTRLSLLPWA